MSQFENRISMNLRQEFRHRFGEQISFALGKGEERCEVEV